MTTTFLVRAGARGNSRKLLGVSPRKGGDAMDAEKIIKLVLAITQLILALAELIRIFKA